MRQQASLRPQQIARTASNCSYKQSKTWLYWLQTTHKEWQKHSLPKPWRPSAPRVPHHYCMLMMKKVNSISTNTTCFKNVMSTQFKNYENSILQSQAQTKTSEMTPTMEDIETITSNQDIEGVVIRIGMDLVTTEGVREVATEEATEVATEEDTATEVVSTTTIETGGKESQKTNRKTNRSRKNDYSKREEKRNKERERKRNRETEQKRTGTPPFWRMLATLLAPMAAAISSRGEMGSRRSEITLAAPPPSPENIETKEAHPSGGGVAGQGSADDAARESDSGDEEFESTSELNLHRSQKRFRQPETSHQSAMVKRPCQSRPLQDVYDEGCQSWSNPELLDGENRSKELLLAASGAQETPSVSFFSTPREELLLPMPTLRPQREPIIHYEALQASHRILASQRTQNNHIYRRYAHFRRDETGVRRLSSSSHRANEEAGGHHQPKEISFQPFSTSGVPGLHHRLRRDDYYCPEEKDREYQKRRQEVLQAPSLYSEATSFNFGQDKLASRRNVPRSGVHCGLTSTEEHNYATDKQGVGLYDPSLPSSQERSQLVAQEHPFYERSLPPTSSHRPESRDRRVGQRMGSVDIQRGGQASPFRRSLLETISPRTHQLQRTISSQVLNRQLSQPYQEQDNRHWDRQHYSTLLHQQNGGEEHASRTFSVPDLRNLKITARNTSRALRDVSTEHNSRRRVESGVSRSGHATQPASFQNDRQGVGPTHHRHVFDLSEQTTGEVWGLEALSRSDLVRLNVSLLEERKRLGTPPLRFDTQSFEKSGARAIDSDTDRSFLASSAVVSPVVQSLSRFPPSAPSVEQLTLVATSPQTTTVGNTRLEDIRQALLATNISEEVIKNTLQVWSEKTNKGYEAYWKSWKQFCEKQQCTIFTTDKDVFNGWLSTLVDDQKSQASLEKARSVVSSTMKIVTGVDLGGQKIAQMMSVSAARQNRPKSSKYSSIFDLCYVFENFFIEEIPSSYKDLTQHTIIVAKAVLGWRGDDLSGVTRNQGIKMIEGGMNIRFFDGKINKKRWSGWTFVPKLRDEQFKSLCLVTLVETIFEKSNNFPFEPISVQNDKGEDIEDVALFTSEAKKGNAIPLRSTTINTKVMQGFFSQISLGEFSKTETLDKHFSAHAMRHAVASALAKQNVPIEKVANHLQTTTQSLQQTYVLPVQTKWKIPKCVDDAEHLVHKLLIPFTHSQYVDGEKVHCKCSEL